MQSCSFGSEESRWPGNERYVRLVCALEVLAVAGPADSYCKAEVVLIGAVVLSAIGEHSLAPHDAL